MTSSPENLKKAIIFSLLTALAGSLAAATAKHLSQQVHASVIVFVQYCLCLLTLTPWLAKVGLQGLKTQHPWLHLIRGVSGWLCFYTYYLAVGEIPLVDASLLRNTAPLFVPFFVFILHQQTLSWIKGLGIAIGLMGILLILQPEGAQISGWHGMGLLSGITLALSMIYTRELSFTEPSNRILFYYFGLSLLLSTPLAIQHYTPVPLTLWPGLVFVGFSIFLTMTLYNLAYANASANTLAPFSYFGVIFAGILGWILWDHAPDLKSIAGMGLVISGGIISLMLRNQPKTH